MKDHPSQWIASGLTCRAVTERTSDYLDDRLPILTKIRVCLHLGSCSCCREYMKQISHVRDVVGTLPRLYPSPLNRLRLRQQFAAHHAN